MGIKRKGLWLRPNQTSNQNHYKKNKARSRQERHYKNYRSSGADAEGSAFYAGSRSGRF